MAEIKNLKSFRSVERAAEYEFKRQVDLLERGESVVQEMVELLAEAAAVVFDRMDAHRRMQIYTKVQELLELFNTGGWRE